MRSSKLKQKAEPKKKIFSKKKLVSIEDPNNITTKFKNEAFNKLMERNLENQERLNTVEFSERPQIKNQRNSSTKKSLRIPRSNSAYRRENSYSNRNRLSSNSKRNYYENLSKSRKNLLEMVPDQDDPELYPTNVIRAKKIFRDPYSANKYKEYPNLIGGVLTQANLYNVNDNKNYNDSIRYKPLDDIFNEQSSIFSRKVNDNNNSSNMSFNSDFKRDARPDQLKNLNASRNNNIRKIKLDENNSTIDNNTINTINTINDSNDKEIKIKRNSIKERKSETFENNGKKLSPIASMHNSNEIQRENTNDMIKEYIKTYTNKNNEKDISPIPRKSEVEKDLRNILIIENVNNFTLYNHEKNNNKNAFIGNLKQSSEEDFVIYKSYDMNKDIGKDKNNKENQFNNLETEKSENLSYNYKKSKGEKNIIRSDDNDGKLSFNNDDEILNYIKKKIKEEKENEYYKGKMKYNYFILTKKFHGKVLYEIGLENDLNEINNILKKENVEVEHEPVAFITLKELAQLKDTDGYKEIERLKNDNLKLKEEIENLNQENKKLQKDIDIMNVQNKKFNNKNNDESEKLKEEIEKLKVENERLKNKLNTQKENLERNTPLVNDNNKLMDELSNLNEKNKEIEHQLKEKQNLIEEYEYEIKILKEKEKDKDKDKEKEKDKDKEKEADSNENKKLIEDNKRLQAEREKFIKYINELNEYDEKVISEYKKVKAQLQIEIQKNNMNKNNAATVKKYFTNRELGIISNKMINIVTSQVSQIKKQAKNKKSENVIDFMDSVEIMNTKPEGKDEMTQTQEESNYYKDFYDENKGSYKGSLNSNTKQSIRESRDDKKFQRKKLPLKNEDYIDENKKKNKIGFNDEEEDDWDNFIPRNKREESLKRAMKRLEYKKKRDEEKNKFRKSEKITGMAGDLEEALNKRDGRLYMDEDYDQNKDYEDEEYDDNYYE